MTHHYGDLIHYEIPHSDHALLKIRYSTDSKISDNIRTAAVFRALAEAATYAKISGSMSSITAFLASG